jgi:hypothetical protein
MSISSQSMISIPNRAFLLQLRAPTVYGFLPQLSILNVTYNTTLYLQFWIENCSESWFPLLVVKSVPKHSKNKQFKKVLNNFYDSAFL